MEVPGSGWLLQDSLGNSVTLSQPVLHWLVAALSVLVLARCLRRERQEERIDESRVRIVEDVQEEEESRRSSRVSFLLPTPTFQWPQQAPVLEEVRSRKEGTTELSPGLRNKLEELGILKEGSREGQEVEGRARSSGGQLPRRSIRISFDTFQAKARPGLENSSEDESLKLDAVTMTRIMLNRVGRRKSAAMACLDWRGSGVTLGQDTARPPLVRVI